MGGFGGDILSSLGIGQYPRRLSPSWNPNARGVRPETLGNPGALGNPVGTPIPMDADPTLRTMDDSGAGLGPNSSAPPNLGRIPASTTSYEQTLASPPQRRGGLRGVLGTLTEVAGGLAGTPAITQLGSRLAWGPNQATPQGARTPEEYQANLQRLAAMSQIDQRNLQQQYLNQWRQERIDNQRQTAAFQRQKDQEAQQQKFETWQGKTEELPQAGTAIAPTPTPSQLPTQLPIPAGPPIPGSAIGATTSLPPAFDPGTGATVPVSGRPDEQGQIVTQVNPTTKQPESRFAPSAATLRARNLAAASQQKQADMMPLEPNVDAWAAQNLGTTPGQSYSAADAKDIRDKFINASPQLSGKQTGLETPLKSQRITDINAANDLRYQALYPGKKLPDSLTLKPGATERDSAQVEQQMNGFASTVGAVASREATAATRADTQSRQAEDQQLKEAKQYRAPYQKMSDGVSSQLDKILDAEKMVSGGAVDQALGVPKVLTALVSGQGSGVRITQAELNAIYQARGIGGDIQGFLNRLAGQGRLTAEQKTQLNGILSDVRARVQQKQAIADAAIDGIESATSRDQRVAIDRDARRKLAALEGGAAAPTGGTPGDPLGIRSLIK